ncbi:ORP1, variant [Blastomyces dermatitidis ATCC 18188]|uniref:ORP1 n=1 Tax=Ajellomyces dermatitidis (strain ATCC 18188 / CBS 674.68) TaxID=653446 RepID=F2TAT3_AJEDA|nr:ORP1 [Blastomyces dermatitidis ATCC 18188]KMW67250.1 ORP1, variant [Blastomyces dermatitidis ATCC 18188]
MAASFSEPLQIETRCQFSGQACSTESNHYRKVISHIFGRNKKCTVNIPQHVWIYYCRKHYQRARYRTAEWPFRQCDLAIETVQNMRAWGGVQNFNLQLRRRETWRTARQINEEGNDGEKAEGDQDEAMLDAEAEAHEPGEPSPSSKSRTFTPINRPPRVKAPVKEGESDYHGNEDEDESEDKNLVDSVPTDEEILPPKRRKKKRSPTIIPHPVPNWLHTRVGPNKTFDEILSVLRDLRAHLTEIAQQKQLPHFPDIEILPSLRPRSVTPSCSTRGDTRPTLRRPLPLIDSPTSRTGLITSAPSGPTQGLTRRSAASETLHRPTRSTQTAPPTPQADTSPTITRVRRATDPSIRSPAGPDSAAMSSEASDNDASNQSLKYAIGRAACLINPTCRALRVSDHGAVKKTTKRKINKS